MAATSYDIFSGISIAELRGITENSANAPEDFTSFEHLEIVQFLQLWQIPQLEVVLQATLFPMFSLSTFLPTSTISPLNSCPKILGGVEGNKP